MKNGKVVAVGEEERFNRIKTTSNLPIQSIKYVLKEASISFDKIDHIAIAWDCLKYPTYMDNFRKNELQGRTELDELIDQIKTTNDNWAKLEVTNIEYNVEDEDNEDSDNLFIAELSVEATNYNQF